MFVLLFCTQFLDVAQVLTKYFLPATFINFVTLKLLSRLCFLKHLKFLGIQNLNTLSANPTKWSNTPKQFVGNNRQIV